MRNFLQEKHFVIKYCNKTSKFNLLTTHTLLAHENTNVLALTRF